MKTLIILVLMATSLQVVAKNHKEHKHNHSLKSHNHGHVEMEIGIEGNLVEIELDGPSESFLGFEHTPKTAAEKATFNKAMDAWTKNLLTLINFHPDLNCQITATAFEQTPPEKNSHSEIEAEAKLSCEKSPNGSVLKIYLIQEFSKVKNLKLEVIGTKNQTFKLRKPVEEIEL